MILDSGSGQIYVSDGRTVSRVLSVPNLDRFGYTRVELDISDTAVTVMIGYKPCLERTPDGQSCSAFHTGGPERTDAWLLRDGCPARLLARTTRLTDAVDTPTLVGDHVFILKSHAQVATLRARRLRSRCGLGPARVALPVGRWQGHLTVAVAGDHAYVARDDGIRRLPLKPMSD